jgi:hypothetical protein
MGANTSTDKNPIWCQCCSDPSPNKRRGADHKSSTSELRAQDDMSCARPAPVHSFEQGKNQRSHQPSTCAIEVGTSGTENQEHGIAEKINAKLHNVESIPLKDSSEHAVTKSILHCHLAEQESSDLKSNRQVSANI